MLNTTKVLRHIEKKLGFKFTDLEIDENEIMDEIRQNTLRVYSKYYPYITRVDITTQEKIDGKINRFIIDPQGLEIMSMNRLILGNMEYIDPSIITRPNYQADIFSTILANDMMSMVRNPITFNFMEPNILEVYPSVIGLTNVMLFVNAVHPEHLGTIRANMEDQFLKLAYLDIADMLYMIRARFANMTTPYGNIELMVDRLQDAADKREELLQEWRRQSNKNANRKRIFIA